MLSLQAALGPTTTLRRPSIACSRDWKRRRRGAPGATGGGNGASEASPAPLAKQQAPPSWGYYGSTQLQWTFDDVDGDANTTNPQALQPTQQQQQQQQLAAAAAAAPPPPDPNPILLLSRLPEQLGDPHALTRGVLLVDKPPGWTAGDVVRAVRWALRGGRGTGGRGGPAASASAAGAVSHAGALDRHATGLMVLCLGTESAALLGPRCASLERVYTGTITLGVETDTWDAWARDDRRGTRAAAASVAAATAAAAAAASDRTAAASAATPPPVSSQVVDTMPWEHVTDEAIAAAASALCGGGSGGGDAGLLLPAAPRSGGKRAGRSAAWYEERGAAPPAPLPARRVPVREFAVWREGTLRGGASSPVLSFRLAAGPGASPRALAHALGEALGTCAHLSSLRREALGGLSVERAWPLDALLPALQAGQGQMRAARRQRR